MIKLLCSTALVTLTARAFMSDTCKTVQIKGKDGNPITINESDYDEKEHGKPWQPTKAALAKQQKQANKDAGDSVIDEAHGDLTEEQKAFNERIESTQFGVFGEGRKFFVCDSATENPTIITDMIDPATGESVFQVEGYKAQKDAWADIQALKSRITTPGDTGFNSNLQTPPETE